MTGPERLAFDVPSSPDLDAVVRLAVQVSGAGGAVLTVFDDLGDCTLAAVGLPEGPRHVPAGDSLPVATADVAGLFVSADITTDVRLSGLPAGRLAGARGYTGVVVLVEGAVVGQLAVVDPSPWTPGAAALAGLADLALVAGAQLQARRDQELAEELTVGMHATSADLARSRDFVDTLLEALPVGVVATDSSGRPTLFNRTVREWSELDLEDEPAADPDAAFGRYHLYQPDGTTPMRREENALAVALRDGEVHEQPMVIAPPGRPARAVHCSGKQMTDGAGTVVGAVIVLSDVTERQRLERELQAAATRDPLTGLPNRRLLLDRLDHVLGAAARSCTPVTLLYCDLDGFKAVNDLHGHAAGDEVLVAVAERLTRAVRPGDTVARLGGDEFVVLCPGLADSDAVTVAGRIESALAVPVRSTSGDDLRVGVSTGWSTTDTGQSAAELLAAADAEMFRVKQSHHARV